MKSDHSVPFKTNPREPSNANERQLIKTDSGERIKTDPSVPIKTDPTQPSNKCHRQPIKTGPRDLIKTYAEYQSNRP